MPTTSHLETKLQPAMRPGIHRRKPSGIARLAPNLHPEERAWLTSYRQVLKAQYPGMIERMVVFGSKTRGDAREDSDLDILLLLDEKILTRKLESDMRHIGHRMAWFTRVKPAIKFESTQAWAAATHDGFPFHLAVGKEGVDVYE